MNYLPLIGRILFSLIFLSAVRQHFTPEAIGYGASKGVPMANIAVPLAGVIAGLGAISIILGFKARIGAWLIVLFLVPVTFTMHNFWTETDAMMKQMQMTMFMKNISMLGGALIIAYFGAGPVSLDNRVRKGA